MRKFRFKKIELEEFFNCLTPYSLATGFFLAYEEIKNIPLWSYVLKSIYLSFGCLLLLGFISLIIVCLYNYLISNAPSEREEMSRELSEAKFELFSLREKEAHSDAGKFFADYGCIVPENNPNGHYHFFSEDCPELNIKENPFYIYNKSTALNSGLTACPHCYGKQIKSDEPQ